MSFLKALNVPKILRLVLYFKYYNLVCFKLEKKIGNRYVYGIY